MKKVFVLIAFIHITVNSFAQEIGVFTDLRDGNIYKTVKIGNQIWMAENLRYDIPTLNPNFKSHFAYDDNIDNIPKNGYLYSFWDACKICPGGWQLPSMLDWEILINTINNEKGPFEKKKDKLKFYKYQSEWFGIGQFLKDSLGWDNSGNGSNYYGFSATPSGQRNKHFKTGYRYWGQIGSWWSSSAFEAFNKTTNTTYISNIYYISLNSSNLSLNTGNADLHDYLSVRCIKGWTKDDDGENVNSVTIGNQEWMNENLNTTTFRNGDAIHEAKNYREWNNAIKEKKPIWCYYNFNKGNEQNYGKLYNWYAVNDSRGLAPEGWHIPSDLEWNQLAEYLGGEKSAGKSMKLLTGWKKDSHELRIICNGTNESGFSAIPGGFLAIGKSFSCPYTLKVFDFGFNNFGESGYWWSSTEKNAKRAWGRSININPFVSKKDNISIIDGIQVCDKSQQDDMLHKKEFFKGNGFSVRCIKD